MAPACDADVAVLVGGREGGVCVGGGGVREGALGQFDRKGVAHGRQRRARRGGV